jgi:NitT/TauT family transport system permease protein
MKKSSCLYLISLISLLISYYFLSLIVNNEVLLPTIRQLGNYFYQIEFNEFLKNVSHTLLKALSSYLISMILAFILAIIARYKKLYLFINPYISILKTIPTISIILIVIVWLGNELAIYLIPFLVIFPLLYETIFYQLKNVDVKLIAVTNVYRFSLKQKLKYLYFYPLLEGLMLSFKQTFGLCLKIIVMAEVLAQGEFGIGAKIQNERINIEMSGVFAWTIILIVIILVIDFVLDTVTKRVIKWKCYNEN